MQVKSCSRSLFTFTSFKKKPKQNKSCATNNAGRKEQYIPHSRLHHRHRQSTEVFECHKKTVTRKTSLQRRRRRLSGKHCLNFVFSRWKRKPLAQSASVAKRRRHAFSCRYLRSLVDIHYDAFLQLEHTRGKKMYTKNLFRTVIG